jgi:hypothetical protein
VVYLTPGGEQQASISEVSLPTQTVAAACRDTPVPPSGSYRARSTAHSARSITVISMGSVLLREKRGVLVMLDFS